MEIHIQVKSVSGGDRTRLNRDSLGFIIDLMALGLWNDDTPEKVGKRLGFTKEELEKEVTKIKNALMGHARRFMEENE